MPTSMTALRRGEPDAENPLERVRDLAMTLAHDEGHLRALFPNVCIYRFTRPTTFRKAATFGVTLGAVLQGRKLVRIGAHEFPIDPSRLLVITRESEHESAVLAATREEPYVGLSLCFGPERVARALLALVEAGGVTTEETAPAFVSPCDPAIAGALERLLLSLGDPLDRKLLAPLVIDEILFRLLRSPAAAAIRGGVGPAADANRILEAMRFMREHHADKLNVEQLARHSAMSPSHFAHRFRSVARISPMRYLREARLDIARTHLLERGSRVSEVAVAVGFESPAHFTREFKRRFGVSPSKSLSALPAASPVVRLD